MFLKGGNKLPQKIFEPTPYPFMIFRNKTKEAKSSPLTPYHRHDAYEVFLFLSGNRKVCIEQSCFSCQPGDMFIISPNQLHAGMCDEDCEYDRLVINIKQDFIDSLSEKGIDFSKCFEFENTSEIKHVSLSIREREALIDIYDKFEYSRSHDGYGRELLNETYIIQVLIHINRWFLCGDEEQKENLMPTLISDVMEYIHEHLTEEISLSDLERNFYFSGRHISKVFKEHTGITVRTYIIDQRIALAKKLLSEGCNVSEACGYSGFCDYANFVRSFKNYVGISPGKYAKQIK